jgi:hypothetical protein
VVLVAFYVLICLPERLAESWLAMVPVLSGTAVADLHQPIDIDDDK